MTDPIERAADQTATLVEFAKIGLRSLRNEWLKILESNPHRSDAAYERLKKDSTVAKLLADIERAKAAIASAEASL